MTRCFRVVDLRVSIFIFLLHLIVTPAELCSLLCSLQLSLTDIEHCGRTPVQKLVHQA